ncbi:hypothetical protein [Amaricoccus sp.]|uniref:hypothetical protein n=1 Tax=Amaricoccus sp. TaxID=1872485 RepID=UPI001B6408A5|nr:hypothetical protein [Amaricoccus sp.]MBP7001814.1 hypothetical protein [Amaricoccus sp.]
MHAIQPILVALLCAAGPAAAATLDFHTASGRGDGYVVDTSNPAASLPFSFVMVGNDRETEAIEITRYFATAGARALRVSGEYAFLSKEYASDLEMFGYFNGADYRPLTTIDYGIRTQTGAFAFLVRPNATFGWYEQSVYGGDGGAVVTVGASIVPVPLPGALWAALAGLGALAAAARPWRPGRA